jgi:hypothetical protein
VSRGVTVSFNADVARFTSGVDKITNDLSKFQSNADRVSKNINNVLGNIGVGLSAAGVVAFGKSVIDGLDKLNDLSKTTGLAVNTLAGLGVAAKQSGADLDSVAAAVSKLSVNMGKDGDKFRALGITAKEPLEAFKQLADIFVSIKDPQERAAVAAEALGKSWQGTAPLLSEGGAAIGRMVTEGEKAAGVTKEMAEQADKFNDELEAMKARLAGVAVSLTGELLPAMNSVLDKLRAASSSSGGILSFFTASKQEEANAAATITNLQDKVASLKKMREELTAPTLANKLNNSLLGSLLSGGVSDIKTIDNQIFAVEKKIAYLQSLTKKADAVIPASPSAKGPSKSSISAFLGNSSGDNSAKAAAKAAEAEAKRLADAREKIFQHEIDTELKEWGDFHKEKERLAKEGQTALDNLMKEGQNLKFSVDPMARMNAEVARYSELLKKGAIDQKTFDLAVAQSTDNMKKATTDGFEKMSAAAIGFQTNVQRGLGDGIYRALNGDFESIGEAWKTLLFRMMADALAADLSSKIFGKNGVGGLLSMFGSIAGSLSGLGGAGKAAGGTKISTGGTTGFAAKGAFFDGNVAKFALGGIVNSPTPFQFASGGSFHNGLMGEAGPEAIMPLKRDSQGRLGVSGGGSGRNVVITQNINIDSRTDRTEVHAIVSRAVKQGNADLVDRLDRQGRI